MMTTGSNGVTARMGTHGETILSSSDPWYRLFRAIADLFLAGEITIDDLQDEEVRWSSVHMPGVGFRSREITCPAARKLL
jgi:hypothetical protein